MCMYLNVIFISILGDTYVFHPITKLIRIFTYGAIWLFKNGFNIKYIF